VKKEEHERILAALYHYYLEDITFEKAAEEAGVPLFVFINFANNNNLPIVHTEEDVREGFKKVLALAKKAEINL